MKAQTGNMVMMTTDVPEMVDMTTDGRDTKLRRRKRSNEIVTFSSVSQEDEFKLNAAKG